MIVRGKSPGATRLPPELKGIRHLNKFFLSRLFSKYSAMTIDELNAAWEDPQTAAIDRTIITAFRVSYEGEFQMIGWLFNRIFGRPGDTSIAEEEEKAMHKSIANMSKTELLARARKAVEEMEAELGDSADLEPVDL